VQLEWGDKESILNSGGEISWKTIIWKSYEYLGCIVKRMFKEQILRMASR
jgi:hypothetical protein